MSDKSFSKQFKQQDLKAWQPVLTPVAVIALLLVVAVIFMPIGIVLRDASMDVVEQTMRYDNIAECYVDNDMTYVDLPVECKINFTIETDMKAPVYFYYELHNYYQNHRRYLKSKTDEQLRGEGNTDVSDCSPLKKYGGKYLVGCGLVASSFFEDRFSMSVNGENLCSNCINYGKNNSTAWHTHWSDWHDEPNWSMDNIAWNSDLDDKFIYRSIDNSTQTQIGERQNVSGLRLPDVDNEDFVVWMRVAALPDFRKLHRKLTTQNLYAGDNITVTILNWFPTTDFDGEKWIVLSTTEWCGGENFTLAWTYIAVSIVAIVLAVAFAVLLLFGSRKMGAAELFEWHNRPKSKPLVEVS